MTSSAQQTHHPNRELPESKRTRALVVVLLLISAALMALVTIGGWSALAGGQIVQLFYIAVYVAFAVMVSGWNRGSLALAVALALILIIFAAIAGTGWYARDKSGFDDPLLPESILGTLTLVIIPLQILLIVYALRGFMQNWNTEG